MKNKIKSFIISHQYEYVKYFVVFACFFFGLFVFPPLAGDIFSRSLAFQHFYSLGGQWFWALFPMLIAGINLISIKIKWRKLEIISMGAINTLFIFISLTFSLGSWTTAIPIYTLFALFSGLVTYRLIHE